jgi:HrpA-like RNA helicase
MVRPKSVLANRVVTSYARDEGPSLPPQDQLRGSPALAVARVDTGGRDTLIQLALPLDSSTLEELGEREGTWVESVSWDASRQQVKAERRLQLGDLVLRRTPQSAPSPEQCQALLLNALHEAGTLEALPWTAFNQQLRQRLSWMHRHDGPPWPPRDRGNASPRHHLARTDPPGLPKLARCFPSDVGRSLVGRVELD